MAFALVLLIFACAVAPVTINMAGLHLRAQAVELDAHAQQLRAEMRDLGAQMAGLSAAPVLEEQAKTMGMVSAQSVSYLVMQDGSADGGRDPLTAAADGDSGVAWVMVDAQTDAEGAATANAP